MLTRSLAIIAAIAALIGAVAFVATRSLREAAPAPAAQAAAPAKAAAPTASEAPETPGPAPLESLDPDAYTIKSILPIDGPLKMGDYHWDESAAPKTGTLVVTVDLAAQVLSVFRDGHEIGAAAILFGADAKPTPLGVYPITQKDADHVSNLYDAPMPYMLRLTNDGVAVHASEVAEGYMTHGCIGVPLPFAKKLFDVAKLGDKVIITRGETLSVGEPVKAI
ncbi:L,D-transpeptidase family protein [Sphingomonas dokdonensis]|uniref:Putative L,D-transpeptidase LppS n=1 Tax=Sphingomonas dokdonensis TaxID=344880 RepID=A0A245ZN30_9SPHN|nr:L,D-transpeptidase family protein [Sphingomonas dokdonensis]OWK31143.1 putative L,D-transpeptidase LppS precursor [Sphingomonas dokdonensis]